MPELNIYPPVKFKVTTNNSNPTECGRYASEDNLIGVMNIEVWAVRRGGSRDTLHGIKEIDFKKAGGLLTILRIADPLPVDAKGTISGATFSISKVNNTGGAVVVTGVDGIEIDWFVTMYLKILK